MSEDLKRRVLEHQRGKVESTSPHLPAILIHYEAYVEKEDAEAREQYLKTSDGIRDLKRQLSHTLKKYQINK